MVLPKCFPIGHGQIEVHLHRHIRCGPCSPLQVIDVLKSEPAAALFIRENEPIDIIRRAIIRGLVSWPVLESEQETVELCQSSHIGSVENRVKYLRESGHGPRLTIITVP